MNKDNSPQSKTIDISSENIGLPTPSSKNPVTSIYQQNRFFKKQNHVLRKELDALSQRLDTEIKKRGDSKKTRPWSRNTDEVSFIELQNAYKKCQIYKKEVNFYRKRLSSIQDESKYDQNEQKINDYMKENIHLKEQIKSLNKLIKIQEKGLIQMGAEQFTKLVKDSERLKQENRKLKKNLNEYRIASLNLKDQTDKPDDNSSSKLDQGSKQEESMRDKLEKSYMKIKTMSKENNHLRDLIENYKFQMQQKDKEISLQKERIANLRKNNEQLLSEVSLKRSMHYSKSNRRNAPKGDKSQGLRVSQTRVFKTEPDISYNTQPMVNSKKMDAGLGSSNSVKWSDQVFNSKIKQIQVMITESGGIRDVHARYEKGEPKKYDSTNPKLKSSVLTCSENQYIKVISGTFYNGYLTFLSLVTNNKRGQNFGKESHPNDPHSSNFSFQVEQTELIGALYGEKSEEGLTKLGCLILKA